MKKIYYSFNEIMSKSARRDKEEEIIKENFIKCDIKSFDKASDAEEEIKESWGFVFSACEGIISRQSCRELLLAIKHKKPIYFIDRYNNIFRTDTPNIKKLEYAQDPCYFATAAPVPDVYIPDLKAGNMWAITG